MSTAVGIDLGTTNSAVAFIDSNGVPAIIPNQFGSPVTPSVVAFRGNNILVGEEAKQLQALGEQDVVAFFKQQMGVPNFAFYVGDKAYGAVDLSSFVLKQLKEDAERALQRPVTKAVITVPAYFRNPQREATKAAGKAAGLSVLQVINEPTAASIAYGFRYAHEDQTLVVYDLGGGTFDVTILRVTKRELRVLTSDGDIELGGKNWDYRIIEFIAAQFDQEYGEDIFSNAVTFGDLLVRAEEAKKQLSNRESTTISVTHEGRQGRYTLTRAHFQHITSDLMERTVSLTRKALDDIHLDAKQVDGVVLVGGSTRMPAVREFVTTLLGKVPRSGVNPDEAVALGAAIQAAEASDIPGKTAPKYALGGAIKTVDVTNHSLGMIAVNQDGSAYINAVILPKNKELPCLENRPFQHRANQLEIYLTQGETESPADVTYLGKYQVSNIPRGTNVLEIGYAYDVSGTVQVSARMHDTHQPLFVSVEPLPPDVPDRFLRPPEPSLGHVTVHLAFDLSGSMSGNPLREAKKAAEGFLKNIDLTAFSVGIMGVADWTKVYLPPSQNAKQITAAIHSLEVGDVGGGNEGHPFDVAKAELETVSGTRYLIVLADGVWDDQRTAIARVKACHASDIEVIGVGFGGADEAFLKAISSMEGGSFYTGLDGLVETFSTIAQVLTETSAGTTLLTSEPAQRRSSFRESWSNALRRRA